MKNNLHVFLGATVADAAARPLHWVYDQKKLKKFIKLKEFTKLKRRKPRNINEIYALNEQVRLKIKSLCI